MSPLLQRILTALVLIPVAVGAVVLGGWWFVGVVVVASCLAQWELYTLGQGAGAPSRKVLGLVCGALVVTIPAWSFAVPLAVLALLVMVGTEIFREQEDALRSAALGVLGVAYPAALVSWYIFLRLAAPEAIGDAGAAWLVIAIFVSVWAADTAAYFTGRSIGRRPLAPSISPKKTIEGTVGGIVGALLVLVVMQVTVLPFITLIDALALGLIAGVLGPVGDLTESLFKRSVGAKDSGSLLPGHGGMLDRIDAMIFVGPPAVMYLSFVARVF